jgi:hypothetical protein
MDEGPNSGSYKYIKPVNLVYLWTLCLIPGKSTWVTKTGSGGDSMLVIGWFWDGGDHDPISVNP